LTADKLDKIKFGTDGWRGIIGFDFNLSNLSRVVVAACQELHYQYYKEVNSKKIIIGYDRRFMSCEFAKQIVPFVRGCGFEPILSDGFGTTPSCSFYAKEMCCLGALVITASHNPYNWLGLKIKSFNGCSVDESFTIEVEKRLMLGNLIEKIDGVNQLVDIKKFHLDRIKSLFDIGFISNRLKKMKLRIFVDSMHGSAANCMAEIFASNDTEVISEIRKDADPFFGGKPPEPLLNYVDDLNQILIKNSTNKVKTLGIIFDGDGDRIAAIDEKGRYCNTQLLMPVLIDHLARFKNMPGCVVKTVSGSDLMRLVAEDLGREVIEKPVGFKYIAEDMLSREVLIGGEESGGVGFGHHLPERDALFTALLLLESIVADSRCLGEKIDSLHTRFGKSHFERIDLALKDMEMRRNLENFMKHKTPSSIGHKSVLEVISTDGIKLVLDKSHWLMFRFSGTEPLLRIYCEAPSSAEVTSTLYYAKQLIDNSFG